MLHLAATCVIVYNYTFFITICSHYRQAFAFFDKIHQMKAGHSRCRLFAFKLLSMVKG